MENWLPKAGCIHISMQGFVSKHSCTIYFLNQILGGRSEEKEWSTIERVVIPKESFYIRFPSRKIAKQNKINKNNPEIQRAGDIIASRYIKEINTVMKSLWYYNK